MYIPEIYKNHNQQEVIDFIKANSFSILVTQHNGKPTATHIPLEYGVNATGMPILTSHIAKRNPQWKTFKDNPEVLVIFNGPHSYVSSSWYSIEEVPTWNYTAIHVYGVLRIMEQEELMPMLTDLVSRHETSVENPIDMNTFSKATLNQVHGIVGFQITITDIQPAYKLSQGRSAKDHANIINKLDAKQDAGAKGVAKAMRENKKK